MELEELAEILSKTNLTTNKFECKSASKSELLIPTLNKKISLDKNEEVTATIYGDYKWQITYSLHKNKGQTIHKHSKEYYNTTADYDELRGGDRTAQIITDKANKVIVNANTGEARDFREFEETDDRTKWLENLEKSAKKGLEIGVTNFNANTYWQCQSIVLTYKGEMKDYSKLSKDFEIFMKRLKRLYQKFGYKIQSIRVNQLTKNKNWHIHLLLRLQDVETGKWIDIEQQPIAPNEPNPKLNNELTSVVVKDLWGHGDIQMFNCTKDVAGYVVYLFGWIIKGAGVKRRVEEFDRLPEEEKKIYMQEKRHSLYENEEIMKNAGRLKDFPKNAKIYTPSKGLDKPTKKVMTEAELQKELKKNNCKFHTACLYAVEFDKKDGTKAVNLVLKREYWCEVRKPTSIKDRITIIPQAKTSPPVNAPPKQPVLPVVAVPAPAPPSTAVPVTVHTKPVKPIRPPEPLFEEQEHGEQLLLFGFEDNFRYGGLDVYRRQSGY